MQRGPYRAVILYTVKIVVRCYTQFTIRRAVDHRCWSRTEGRCENWAEHHFGEAHALQLLKKASYHPPRQGLPILFKRLIPHSSITLCQDPNKFFFLPDSPALSTCAAGTRREDRTSPSTDAHEQALPFHTPSSTGSLCASYRCASQQAAHTAGVPELLFLTRLPGNIRVTPTGINEEAHPTSFLHPTSVFVQKTATYSPVNNHIFSLGFLVAPMFPSPPVPGTACSTCMAKLHHHVFNTQCRMWQESPLACKDHLRNLQGKAMQAGEQSQELQRCSRWIKSRAVSLSISCYVSRTPNLPGRPMQFAVCFKIRSMSEGITICPVRRQSKHSSRLTEVSLKIILPSPARQARASQAPQAHCRGR